MNFIKRKNKILELRKQGLTLREISKIFNITRQRVHQITFENPKNMGVCFVCKKESLIIKKICKQCLEKYFKRKTGSYLEGIDFTREIARIRDGHICKICHKKWQIGKRRFDIHHLNGDCGKYSRTYDRIENINKLITLCHKCHLNLDEVKDKMSTRCSPRPNKPLPVNLERTFG